jgi:hypothetical protein
MDDYAFLHFTPIHVASHRCRENKYTLSLIHNVRETLNEAKVLPESGVLESEIKENRGYGTGYSNN